MLRFSRLWFGLLLLVLMAALPVQAADFEKYLPADTDAVVAINIQQMLASPLVKTHYLESLQKLIKDNETVAKALKELDFDPLKNVDRIVLANGEGLYRIEKKNVKGKVVIDSQGGYFFVIKGTFDAVKFRAKAEELIKELGATAKAQKVGDVPIWQIEAGERTLFASVLDGTTIAVSSRKESILEALDRATGKKKTPFKYKELQPAINKMDPKKSLALAVLGSAGFGLDLETTKVGGKLVERPVKQMISQDGLDSISGGITMDEGITANIVVGVRNSAAAKDVAKSVQDDLNAGTELIFGLAVKYPKLAPLQSFVRSIKTTTKDARTIAIQAAVTPQEVADSLK